MGVNKRKRRRNPKTPAEETATATVAKEAASVPPPTEASDLRGRQSQSDVSAAVSITASSLPATRSSRHAAEHLKGGGDAAEPPLRVPRWESVVRVVPSMGAVLKVFFVHTELNVSLPWQRKRQYSSSSSEGSTNAHSAEHHTQVKLKKRGSDTKYSCSLPSPSQPNAISVTSLSVWQLCK